MNEKEFADKSIRLSFELSKYIIEHPEFEDDIPNGAEVAILLENDNEFNNRVMELVKKSQAEGQTVALLKVKKLAPPPKSRLVEPELVTM